MPIPMIEPIPPPTVDCPVCGALVTVLDDLYGEHTAAPDAPYTWLRPGEPCPVGGTERRDESPQPHFEAHWEPDEWIQRFLPASGDEWSPDGHRGVCLAAYRCRLDAEDPHADLIGMSGWWPVWYDRTGINL